MYKKVSTNMNFVDREKETLKFWQENKIFEKQLTESEGRPAYTFYDGPPTANGKPHIGHVLTRVIKDMIPRYQTMKGNFVPRKAGWDTHGLPVELEVEKMLGINGKDQIEAYGLEPFIQYCKESVWKYKGMWEDFSGTVGFWADMDDPYVTYHDDFIESEWWALKEIWNKNLKPCLDAIGNFIKNILAPTFKNAFSSVIGPVVDSTFRMIQSLWNDYLKPVFVGITDFLTGVFTLNWTQAWEGLAGIMKGVLNAVLIGIESWINSLINGFNFLIGAINGFLKGIAALSGNDDPFQIELAKTISLPRLEKGGVLEKGQMGFLEGNGAEAVVPLDQNRAWISAVAKDMEAAVGGNGATKLLEQILDALLALDDGLVEKMTDAFASMKFDVNNREFARMVKAVG